MLTLHDIDAGQTVVITNITNSDTELQALRIGIARGEVITCVTKVPAGPIVVQRGGMELAIGRDLCHQIEVEPR